MSQNIPHDFILEFLYPLPIRTKKMFGVTTIYAGDKIVFATKSNDDNSIDNGIWIASKVEQHPVLYEKYPSLRALESYKIQTWLLLPEEANDFEEVAIALCELIKANSPLVGNVPKPRKKKKL